MSSSLPAGARGLAGVGLGRLFVEALAEALARGEQLLGRVLDGLDVGAVEGLLQRGQGALDVVALGALERLGLVLQQLLGLVHQPVGVVADLGLVTTLAVVLGVGLGVAHHAVDLVLGERGAAGDRHRLGRAGRLVLRRDVHDAVRVDVEGHLDLGHAARRRRDADELELAQRLVVRRHLALALEDVHLDRRLVVVGGREGLGLLGRDRGVALDDLGHHAALGLDAERQRGHVEQQDVLDVALQHAGLDGGADGDDLVGVHALVGLLAGHLGDELLDRGDARRATDHDDVVDLVERQPGVLDRLVERLAAPLDQVRGQFVELRAAELDVEVLGTVGGRGDERAG